MSDNPTAEQRARNALRRVDEYLGRRSVGGGVRVMICAQIADAIRSAEAAMARRCAERVREPTEAMINAMMNVVVAGGDVVAQWQAAVERIAEKDRHD